LWITPGSKPAVDHRNTRFAAPELSSLVALRSHCAVPNGRYVLTVGLASAGQEITGREDSVGSLRIGEKVLLLGLSFLVLMLTRYDGAAAVPPQRSRKVAFHGRTFPVSFVLQISVLGVTIITVVSPARTCVNEIDAPRRTLLSYRKTPCLMSSARTFPTSTLCGVVPVLTATPAAARAACPTTIVWTMTRSRLGSRC
jgi:hypothetical protein